MRNICTELFADAVYANLLKPTCEDVEHVV